MSKKILEIKSGDWEKALSFNSEAFVGGIFKQATNYNPFNRRGYLQPSPAATEIGSGTINTAATILSITPYYNTTAGAYKFLVLATVSSALKLYDTDGITVTDVTSSITAGTESARGAGIFQNRYLYINETKVRSVTLGLASDASVLTGLTVANHPFCVGADKLGYIGNKNNVAKIVDATTASGSNVTSVAASLETGFNVRQLLNDGRYLIWLADTATATTTRRARNRCVVAYWDLAKSTFDQLYEFQDAFIAGAEIVGSVIKIVTPNGIYITNFGTKPRVIVPFGDTVGVDEVPNSIFNPFGTSSYRNLFLWGSAKSGANDLIYGHGNLIEGQPEKLFSPFTMGGTSTSFTAMGSDDNTILAAGIDSGTTCKLFNLTSSSTNSTTIANLASQSFPQPFNFGYARVVLRSPISGSDSVSLQLLTSGGTKTVKASETKTNSTDPGEKILVFDNLAAGDSTDVKAFQELSDVKLTTNVAVQSLEVWGDPVDERGSYG